MRRLGVFKITYRAIQNRCLEKIRQSGLRIESVFPDDEREVLTVLGEHFKFEPVIAPILGVQYYPRVYVPFILDDRCVFFRELKTAEKSDWDIDTPEGRQKRNRALQLHTTEKEERMNHLVETYLYDMKQIKSQLRSEDDFTGGYPKEIQCD